MIRLLSILALTATLGAITLPVWSAAVACTQGQLTRKIEVVYIDEDLALPCEVLYDKRDEGTHRTLWRAENKQGYCEEKASQLVQKHQSWGWICTEEQITLAPVPSINEVLGTPAEQ